MLTHRDLRDPIHGFVRIEGPECDIVDTPIFQRLRRIRQLAMAYLVYPGAMHTRFEHTLGVLHVAGRLCTKLDIDDSHRRIVRLAALLHDIGHGPFSHVSEEVLAELATEEAKTKAGGTDKIHELITREIIRSDASLGYLIATKDRDDVITLLDKGLDQPIYRDLVSGPIDADKQDYLLRDSYHCGVRYGLYDIDRLHDVLSRVSDERGDALAVDDDGVHTMEQFVLARYYLTTQVIRHKGRLISDAMLVRGLTLGVRTDKIDFLKRLYSFESGQAFIDEYVSWNDERLVSRLLEPDQTATWAGKFMRRLAERRLFKVMFRRLVTDIPALALNVGGVAAIAPTLESEIAEALSQHSGGTVHPEEVIVKIQKSPPTRKSEGNVLIRLPNGQPQTFESRSLIFKSIDQSLREEHLECYAPFEESDEQRRQKIRTEIGELVTRRVQELLSSGSPTAGVSSEGSHAS